MAADIGQFGGGPSEAVQFFHCYSHALNRSDSPAFPMMRVMMDISNCHLLMWMSSLAMAEGRRDGSGIAPAVVVDFDKSRPRTGTSLDFSITCLPNFEGSSSLAAIVALSGDRDPLQFALTSALDCT